MTMRMAVNLLTEKNQEVQITAANYIQNQCFSSADAKKRVRKEYGRFRIQCQLSFTKKFPHFYISVGNGEEWRSRNWSSEGG